ncbi:uncharacterized protein LOC143214206 [Lasioglossum baleicum]|uniref:uncharacterized protein LOC143214206 n=1 Tax=Lasioglossum baleicum TaxID=434251 RepID=UPI003FCE6F74
MATNGEFYEDERSRHFRDTTSVLPAFDPVTNELTIEEWIEKMEEYGDLYNWDEVAIRHYALAKLKGVARKWRDSLPRVQRTWAQWKVLLKDSFPSDESEVSLRLDAQNYKKKPSQDIAEYFYEKLAKCNRAQMGDREAIEWIADGLNNPRFRDYLGPLSRYKKPSELLADLRSANLYWKETAKTEERRNNPGPRDDNQPRCFACKQQGHTVRTCPKATQSITCFKCGKSGHYSRSCTENIRPNTTVRSGQRDMPARVLYIDGDTHQKYFKNAVISGRSVKCYVDLGSSVTALRQDIAHELGITYHETTLNSFVGYGEGRVQPLGVFTANISIDDVEVKSEIHVVPSKSQAVPLLVGHPYTEHPDVIILSRAGELQISKTDDNPLQTVPYSVTKTTLRASGTYVIPDNYLGHIIVAGDLPDQGLCVEGGLREKGPVIPRCIVSMDEQGETILPVLNITGEELTIKEGDVVSRGEVYEERTCEREINDEPVTSDQVDTDLVGEEADNILAVLNDNRDIIANNIYQIGKTDRATMRIELISEKPLVYRPYRLSYHERQQLRDMTNDLKDADIIEDSASPYASPVLLVRKRNGEVRMCVDYRGINNLTVKDRYPLPRIDDQLDRLRGQKHYASLDLFSSYYQVLVDPKSRYKTAFVTPDGQYQFKRMPFGLCNAPSVFQRMINTVLGSLKYDIALAYLDDVIIPSMTVEEGLARLTTIFTVFREAGLTINLRKCHFFKSQIEYLGFEVSALGIQPSERKVECVRSFPTPKTARDVRSFVGLASYFRRFVKGFAFVAKPLTDLLKKNEKFIWETTQNNAFETIKRMLISKPVLTIYDHSAKTEVHTDACASGLGAVLLQQQNGKDWHPISFYSRKTTPEEAKYHSFELEALAIVCALERFRVYLIGIHFVIKTDCNSLKMLGSKRDLNPRIGRWFVKLSEFDYSIEYHTAKQNDVADVLSRNPVEEARETVVTGLPVLGIKINTDWIAAMQRADAEILALRDRLEAGERDAHDKFTMYNARVYKITKGRW